MRKFIFILGLLLFLSCKERPIPKESNCIFQLPQKEIFVKTSKRKSGNFLIFFATDSLSLNKSNDSIEYETGCYVRIVVDTTDIYAASESLGGKILNMGKDRFKIEFVPESIFRSFFENNKPKYPNSYINIDTKEYGIYVNGKTIKEGDIHGGW